MVFSSYSEQGGDLIFLEDPGVKSVRRMVVEGAWMRRFLRSFMQGFLIFAHFFAKNGGFFTVFYRNFHFLNVFWLFFAVFLGVSSFLIDAF